MIVGGSIHKPQVRLDPRRVGFNLTYRTYQRFVPMSSIANFTAMPQQTLIYSYKIQIAVIAHIIDEVNAYAEKRFSPEILRSYYASKSREASG